MTSFLRGLFSFLTDPDGVERRHAQQQQLLQQQQQQAMIDSSTDTSGSNSSSSYDSSSYEDEDDDDDEEDSSSTSDGRNESRSDRLSRIRQMIQNDTAYFRYCRYEKHLQQILQYYCEFTKYSPITSIRSRPNHDTFSRTELKGLEYLIYPKRQLNQSPEVLEFPAIYINEKFKTSRRITQDTYLVSTTQDYIFSYVIELALIGDGSSRRLPNSMKDVRISERKRRIKSFRPCQLEHNPLSDDALHCPLEWVLYTKKTSEFFIHCQRVVDQNQDILCDVNESYLNLIPLSFYLVNFLCGPLPVATMINNNNNNNTDVTVNIASEGAVIEEDYDQWVIAPLFFTYLWKKTV